MSVRVYCTHDHTTAHYPLPAKNYLLPTTHYPLPPSDIAERNAVFWEQYRPLVQTAESLQAALPWTVAAEIARTAAHAAAAPASLPASISSPPLSDSTPAPVDYTADLVLVPQDGGGEGEEALLFVLPRQFRGIGDQELVRTYCSMYCDNASVRLFTLSNPPPPLSGGLSGVLRLRGAAAAPLPAERGDGGQWWPAPGAAAPPDGRPSHWSTRPPAPRPLPRPAALRTVEGDTGR
jgi:hypothetical protein